MSAVPTSRPGPGPGFASLAPMRVAHLDAVLAIERRAYDFPWTRGNFVDSLAAGYPAERRLDADGALVGYYVAMRGAGEMHLLNLTVDPAHEGRGHGRAMLDALVRRCRAMRLGTLWLEVRAGNARARELYRRRGLAEVGRRPHYYPARVETHPGGREDAIVMSLDLGSEGA